MDAIEKKIIVRAISNLVLADHMGDAYDSTELLTRLLWGDEGVRELADHFEDPVDHRDAFSMRLAEHLPEIWGAE